MIKKKPFLIFSLVLVVLTPVSKFSANGLNIKTLRVGDTVPPELMKSILTDQNTVRYNQAAENKLIVLVLERFAHRMRIRFSGNRFHPKGKSGMASDYISYL